jgi:LemA protein
MPFIILLIVVAVIGLYVFSFYNRVKIPNLVDSVKGYMTHEKGIFDELTAARKSINEAVDSKSGKKIDEAQDLINKALSSLKVIVESNPQIQASGLVGDLMNELRDTADKVMYARRTLIDLTADLNTSIETVPGAWLAPIFGFKTEKGLVTPTDSDQLQVSQEEMKNPKVSL